MYHQNIRSEKSWHPSVELSRYGCSSQRMWSPFQPFQIFLGTFDLLVLYTLLPFSLYTFALHISTNVSIRMSASSGNFLLHSVNDYNSISEELGINGWLGRRYLWDLIIIVMPFTSINVQAPSLNLWRHIGCISLNHISKISHALPTQCKKYSR